MTRTSTPLSPADFEQRVLLLDALAHLPNMLEKGDRNLEYFASCLYQVAGTVVMGDRHESNPVSTCPCAIEVYEVLKAEGALSGMEDGE